MGDEDLEKTVPKKQGVELQKLPKNTTSEEREATKAETYPVFVPTTQYERAISKWLKTGYGVEIWLGERATQDYVRDNKRLYVVSPRKDFVLCHEAAHTWLMLKRGSNFDFDLGVKLSLEADSIAIKRPKELDTNPDYARVGYKHCTILEL